MVKVLTYQEGRKIIKAYGAELVLSDGSKGKNIVVILPDSGDRYLSTELFI